MGWGRLWPCCSFSLEEDKLWWRCTAAPAHWASEAPRCTRWSWTGCWWWTPSPAGWPPSERGWRRRKHLRVKKKTPKTSGRSLACTLHHCIAWCTNTVQTRLWVTPCLPWRDSEPWCYVDIDVKTRSARHSSPCRNNHSCTQMDTCPTVAHRNFLTFLQTNTKNIQSIQQPQKMNVLSHLWQRLLFHSVAAEGVLFFGLPTIMTFQHWCVCGFVADSLFPNVFILVCLLKHGQEVDAWLNCTHTHAGPATPKGTHTQFIDRLLIGLEDAVMVIGVSCVGSFLTHTPPNPIQIAPCWAGVSQVPEETKTGLRGQNVHIIF